MRWEPDYDAMTAIPRGERIPDLPLPSLHRLMEYRPISSPLRRGGFLGIARAKRSSMTKTPCTRETPDQGFVFCRRSAFEINNNACSFLVLAAASLFLRA
jgi:hypothetical protein